jgi:hypothetical protein
MEPGGATTTNLARLGHSRPRDGEPTAGDSYMSDARPVFNIVVTGHTFWHLRFFVCSLVHNSAADFRLVANDCGPEALALLHDYAAAHSDQVVEVMDVSPTRMVAHGVAMDAVRASRDDGELFCFVDPDIKATGPFLSHFDEVLRSHPAVTSGKEVWSDDNVVPRDHLGIGLGGRHFFHPDGFVYGTPHMAMYRRADLDETCERWGIGFGSAGPDLSEGARRRLASAGHLYQVYDTGKVVNILLQLDGHSLRHIDPDVLIHIGGMSHFLAPATGEPSGEVEEPHWAKHTNVQPRLIVARYTAALLRSLIEQRPAPAFPDGLDPAMAARLDLVRREVIDLVERYRGCSTGLVGATGR